LQVASAPPGTQAATLDIEATYRTVPVWPPHKCFLVIEVNGDLFINHVFPFGLSMAGSIQGYITDVTVNILHTMELSPIRKWVNDHLFFRYLAGGGITLVDGSVTEFSYSHGLVEIYNKSCPLGMPWHPKKWCNFTSIFIYLGLLWDIVCHTVTLSDEKQKKY
jgi:hypothetical protein